jgi:hypothetical protein
MIHSFNFLVETEPRIGIDCMTLTAGLHRYGLHSCTFSCYWKLFLPGKLCMLFAWTVALLGSAKWAAAPAFGWLAAPLL